MRILVCGGAGYVGSHTVRLLLDEGHEVTVFDNLSLGHRAAVRADCLVVADLCDRDAVMDVLSERRIEAVIHFAAFANVGESVHDPEKYYLNNAAATLSLLQCMRQCNVKRIIFSSTCAIYGIPASVPITENEKCAPINPYGRSKLFVEWALADYSQAYGLRYAALRYFNAAGAHPDGATGEDHQPETHLIPLVIQAAMATRSDVKIFGADYPTADGTCVRDYIHVLDLGRAHLNALKALERETAIYCNLGTGNGYSVREVIAAVEAVSGRKVAVVEGERRDGDPPVLVADARKATAVLHWTPKYPRLVDIVETAWNWHDRHPHGYADRLVMSAANEGMLLSSQGMSSQ